MAHCAILAWLASAGNTPRRATDRTIVALRLANELSTPLRDQRALLPALRAT